MPEWEYCYVYESLEPTDDGGLVSDYFIARPDRPETRTDIKENQLLAILGSEGWELVSVLAVQTKYSEGRVDMGGLPHPSAIEGSSTTSSTTYYFKRPKERHSPTA